MSAVISLCSLFTDEYTLYMQGLAARKNGELDRAYVLFEKGMKSRNKKNAQAAELCAAALADSGSLSKRRDTARLYLAKFPNSLKAKAKLAEILYETQSFQEIIQLTQQDSDSYHLRVQGKTDMTAAEKADYEEQLDSLNSVMCSRLLALMQLKQLDSSFSSSVHMWFSQPQISDSHDEFYKAFVKFEESDRALISAETIQLMRMRIFVYRRYFQGAFDAFEQLAAAAEDTISSYTAQMQPECISDLGKTLYYASADFEKSASLMISARDMLIRSDNPQSQRKLFLLSFYAARLFDKAGPSFTQQTLDNFQTAARFAPLPENFDNAIWYYLSEISGISAQKAAEEITKYAPQWSDSSYFDDLMELLSSRLLSEKKWPVFYQLYHDTEKYVSPAIKAQYAYICARLIEEKLIPIGSGAESTVRSETIRNLFTAAFDNSGQNLYYRLLAADRLDIPLEEPSQLVKTHLPSSPENLKNRKSSHTERLILGYLEYGFPEKVYPLYSRRYFDVQPKTAAYAVQRLAEYAQNNDTLYTQSLRSAVILSKNMNIPLTEEALKMLYPRFYYPLVSKYCKEYNLPEYLLFALIRTESFFDKDVVSHAGASGLAQLMGPTAADIAKRLKVPSYSLTNASDNIMFGAYYLADLTRRLESSLILALLSYNGGISRVRTWVKNSELPRDLFLETVPFTETRGYGRKVLSSAAVYGYLYYSKNVHEIAREILQ